MVGKAVDDSIVDILSPVVDRSVTIALITKRELVLKDFAHDCNYTKVMEASNLIVQNLSSENYNLDGCWEYNLKDGGLSAALYYSNAAAQLSSVAHRLILGNQHWMDVGLDLQRVTCAGVVASELGEAALRIVDVYTTVLEEQSSIE